MKAARLAQPLLAAALLVFPAAALAGLVLAAQGRHEGSLSIQPGAIQAGNTSIKWADVLLALNENHGAAPASPNAVHLKNGEVWAGTIAKLQAGRITLQSPSLGLREIDVTQVCAIDFAPAPALTGKERAGMLYRIKASPVLGKLLWVQAERVAIDSALGAIALERKDLQRYVFEAAPGAAAASTDDEITLADGSVLRGRVEPTQAGLALKHPVLGDLVIRPDAWQSIRRHSAAAVCLADLPPASVETFPLIRRPADPPRVEHPQPGGPAGFVARINIWPRSVITYRLPGEPGAKVLVTAGVGLTDGSRGSARVSFRLGEKVVFDQVLAPGAEKPVPVSFEAPAASDLKLEVDFDKNVRFPCTVALDDALLVRK